MIEALADLRRDALLLSSEWEEWLLLRLRAVAEVRGGGVECVEGGGDERVAAAGWAAARRRRAWGLRRRSVAARGR